MHADARRHRRGARDRQEHARAAARRPLSQRVVRRGREGRVGSARPRRHRGGAQPDRRDRVLRAALRRELPRCRGARRARQGDLLRRRAHHARGPHRRVPAGIPRRAPQGAGDRRRVESRSRDRAHLEHRHHREAHPPAQPSARSGREHGPPVPADRRRVPPPGAAVSRHRRDRSRRHGVPRSRGLMAIIQAAGLPPFGEVPYEVIDTWK